MKKIILILFLAIFMAGCKNNLNAPQQSTNTSSVIPIDYEKQNKSGWKKISDNIYPGDSFPRMAFLQKDSKDNLIIIRTFGDSIDFEFEEGIDIDGMAAYIEKDIGELISNKFLRLGNLEKESGGMEIVFAPRKKFNRVMIYDKKENELSYAVWGEYGKEPFLNNANIDPADLFTFDADFKNSELYFAFIYENMLK